MTTNLEKFEKDLTKLITEGKSLLLAMHYECNPVDFKNDLDEESKDIIPNLPKFNLKYQSWYSEAFVLIKQLLPTRLNDFESHYKRPKNRKLLNYESYRIEDYFQGLVKKDAWENVILGPSAAIPHLTQQIAILEAVFNRFKSSLFDIKQLLQADLFDSEIQSAHELLKKGFLRASGAVSGVVLEKHLLQVSENHLLKISKKNPTINDLNELLKINEIIETPLWRQIQRLGDIRNYCDHNKEREPKKEEVLELIEGVEKLLKTLY